MLRLLSTLFILVIGAGIAFAQPGEVSGKITDDNGEGVPFANVALKKNGVLITGTATDFDGYYTIKPVDPGTYDLEISALGFGTKLISGVRVNADKITTLNEKVAEQSTALDIVEVIEYKIPLIDKENNSTKTTISAEQIQGLPTRNIQSIVSTTAGVYQADEGDGVSIKGSRTGGTEYYIDGIRVRGSTNIPANSIEQLTVITGGVPPKYGDATGGIINITTKGPSRSFNGGVEMLTSQFLDGFGYNLVNFNLTGPIWTQYKGTDSADARIGFFFAGEYLRQKDGDPSAIGIWVAEDDVLADLQANPLVPSPTSDAFIVATETVTADQLKNVKVKPNSVRNNYSLASKLDFKVTDNINITVGGQVNYNQYHDWIDRYALFNTENNPLYKDLSWRTYARFTQRFGKYGGGPDEQKSAFQNAYYTIQFDYSKQYKTFEDESHGFDPFRYGYLGKFDIERGDIYAFDTDTASGKTGWLLIGQQDTLVTFSPSDINPTTSNYMERYYELAGDNREQYYSSLDLLRINNGILNGDRTKQVHGIWFNVGRQFNGYGVEADNDQYRLSFNGSVDILRPGASTRNKHALEFGFEFEQRVDRSYQINPIELWNIARLQANKHIDQLDQSAPILFIDGVEYPWDEECQCNPGAPVFALSDTVLYNRLYLADDQSFFDKQLRAALGEEEDGLERINIDAVDPDILSLDMFSADELLNGGNPIVSSYYGYDIRGNKLNSQPSFNEFFTEKDEFGNFKREVGAFRPIYTAAYIQDKFSFKDLLFNVGVRIDRYDANQKVLRDKYSLYDVLSVAEAVERGDVNVNAIPGNMGDDFSVYVNDFDAQSPTIVGYRDGDVWYNASGEEISDARILAQASSTGRITPYLDNTKNNDIKDEGYDPNNSFEDYTPQVTVMPRIAFSFNITDEASFFAHYDILTQRPSSGRLITTPVDWYYFEDNIGGAINNPNLKPEKTIDYQVGFRQLVTQNSAITFSAFYRELRDMLQVTNVAYAYPRDYLTFDNIDFGTVKGFSIDFDMRRTKTNPIQLKLAYTIQFAEGTGSSDVSQGNLVSAGQPNLRNIAPFDYDSRHLINVNIDFRYSEGKDYSGPTIKGKQVLSNFGISLLVRARSGEPYTQQANATPEGLQSVPTRPILEGKLNGSRLPWNFKLDFRIDKGFNLTTKKKDGGSPGRPLYLNVYLQIQNLLDTRNIINVYAYTGNPGDDGYLASAVGQQDVEGQINPASYVDLYNAWINNPDNYSLPRLIRLGLRFDF